MIETAYWSCNSVYRRRVPPVWITMQALMRYHHSVLVSFVRRASAFEKREWLKWVESGDTSS
jgi:hypothetical protein